MKRAITCFIALALLLPEAITQIDRTKILSETRVDILRNMAIQKESEYLRNKWIADSVADLRNWPKRMVTDDDGIVELVRIAPDGSPVYYTTNNANAANTTRTDRVHNGGGTGLNLEGQGMTLGIWDGGGVRTTHELLAGRVTQVDNPSLGNHATHVAGTMIGDGTPNANAKGMAPQANLLAYDWSSDESEMAAAAADGLLVSNHSYGTASGWLSSGGNWYWYGHSDYSITESHWFGLYEYSARYWDQIAENAPYYLIVKSAGNDRNDYSPSPDTDYTIPGEGEFNTTTDPRPTDCNEGAGWDCLPTRASAKNVMIVAAVNDVPNYTGPGSVNMTSFSGWGPTDDGRIKPDIAANGASLYSSGKDHNADYYYSTGTSMSSPNVSGSCILLQQQYESVKGTGIFLRASTLRALICHTADECGPNPGPDYQFGWGLMNTERAALHIGQEIGDDNRIVEHELMEGDTFSLFFVSDGNTPLRATIAWTDPAATVSGGQCDDPAIKLVNDLDLRLTQESQEEYLPYILDPANPGNAATNGDNIRDNIEQVFISNPDPGLYSLTVSHKGELDGNSQYFGMILSGGTANICSDDTLDLTGLPMIEEGLYKASETIFANGEVDNHVELEAGNSVVLHPGFTIESQKEFRVQISPCVIAPPNPPQPVSMPDTPLRLDLKPLCPVVSGESLLIRKIEG